MQLNISIQFLAGFTSIDFGAIIMYDFTLFLRDGALQFK
jgi:hypothetical protein